MLTVVFDNAFSFEIDSINEIFTGDTSELVLRCPITLEQNDDEIRKNVTPENMAHFTVRSDGTQVDEFVGYSTIRSVTKVLTRYERTLAIQCTKEGKA